MTAHQPIDWTPDDAIQCFASETRASVKCDGGLDSHCFPFGASIMADHRRRYAPPEWEEITDRRKFLGWLAGIAGTHVLAFDQLPSGLEIIAEVRTIWTGMSQADRDRVVQIPRELPVDDLPAPLSLQEGVLKLRELVDQFGKHTGPVVNDPPKDAYLEVGGEMRAVGGKIRRAPALLYGTVAQFRKYPFYLHAFLGSTMGFHPRSLFAHEARLFAEVQDWFWSLPYDQDWPAIVFAADHKARAGSAAASAGLRWRERPNDVSGKFLTGTAYEDVKRGRIPDLFFERHTLKFPLSKFRLHVPHGSEPGTSRLCRFRRKRRSSIGIAFDEYLTLMSPGQHDKSLRQGRVAGLDRFFDKDTEVVEAPNVILAVLPPPGPFTQLVRDLYVSYSDGTESILFAHGYRPLRLFLATLPEVRRLLIEGHVINAPDESP